MKKPEYILITGLSLVFVWFGIWKLTDPQYWIGWLPLWLDDFLGLPELTWNYLIGVGEIVLGLALFVPVLRFWAALLMVLHLIGVLAMTGLTDIGARDIGLLSIALYFVVTRFPKKSS